MNIKLIIIRLIWIYGETTPTTFVVNNKCQDIEFKRFTSKFIEYQSDKFYKEYVPLWHVCRLK